MSTQKYFSLTYGDGLRSF